MEKTIRKATKLLGEGEAERALAMLKTLEAPTEEGKNLMMECRKVLSDQYIYLLKEAESKSQDEEMYTILRKYLDNIGEDKKLKPYKRFLRKYEKQKTAECKKTEKRQENTDNSFLTKNNGAICQGLFWSFLILFFLIICN